MVQKKILLTGAAGGIGSAFLRSAADTYTFRLDDRNVNVLAEFEQHEIFPLDIASLDAADVPFAIVHGISNNRFKRLDLTDTRNLLGYAPQDDAFEIFQENLPEWLRG